MSDKLERWLNDIQSDTATGGCPQCDERTNRLVALLRALRDLFPHAVWLEIETCTCCHCKRFRELLGDLPDAE